MTCTITLDSNNIHFNELCNYCSKYLLVKTKLTFDRFNTDICILDPTIVYGMPTGESIINYKKHHIIINIENHKEPVGTSRSAIYFRTAELTADTIEIIDELLIDCYKENSKHSPKVTNLRLTHFSRGMIG